MSSAFSDNLPRGDFLKLAGAASVRGVSPTAFAERPGKVGVIIERANNAARSRPVDRAVERLRSAHTQHGIACLSENDAEAATSSSIGTVVADSQSKFAQKFPSGAALTAPESLRLIPGAWARHPPFWFRRRMLADLCTGCPSRPSWRTSALIRLPLCKDEQRGHWGDRLLGIDADLNAMRAKVKAGSSANSAGKKTAEEIRAATSRLRRPYIPYTHAVPDNALSHEGCWIRLRAPLFDLLSFRSFSSVRNVFAMENNKADATAEPAA